MPSDFRTRLRLLRHAHYASKTCRSCIEAMIASGLLLPADAAEVRAANETDRTATIEALKHSKSPCSASDGPYIRFADF